MDLNTLRLNVSLTERPPKQDKGVTKVREDVVTVVYKSIAGSGEDMFLRLENLHRPTLDIPHLRQTPVP